MKLVIWAAGNHLARQAPETVTAKSVLEWKQTNAPQGLS
ncbi:MAG: hypothetical protein ACI8Z1_001202 [Candidatus Azotimanducaceae bacterium]|jgi:hypothetical protein